MSRVKEYDRYHIETRRAKNIVPHPCRFKVKVSRLRLAKLLLSELFHYFGKRQVILSRPCVYGVFSGPIGGFAPREDLCVGCLRCTTQYPEMVQILKNPQRKKLGDFYFTPEYVDYTIYEAEHGRIPIRGAGYRGKFGGDGFDGMWTDMSEIVRPTRDGIHGREYISTEVDIGSKPRFLSFNKDHEPEGELPKTVKAQIPFLFDLLPGCGQLDQKLSQIVCEAAKRIGSFAIFKVEDISRYSLKGPHIIPLFQLSGIEALKKMELEPFLLEMAAWDENFYKEIRTAFPAAIPILRTDFEDRDLISYYRAGIRVFHFSANYHGRGKSGKYILDLIREAEELFLKEKCRDEVFFLGGGGIIAAEHLAKGILCGLDAAVIDTPLLVALQAKFEKPGISLTDSHFLLPQALSIEWGVQRLVNMAGSWRDQLLEILGAMGLREVRRLRGEMGRAMFQKDLEKEAFEGISGYES